MPENVFDFSSEISHLAGLNLHYVTVPGDLLLAINKGEKKGLYKNRFWIEVNHQVRWQGAAVSLGDNNGYITLSKARMKELNVHFQDTVHVQLTLDESEYGMEMAEEVSAILEYDEEAKNRFDSLNKGMQRYILYYVLQVKSSEKRLERATFLFNNLKLIPEGEETFRKILGKD